MLSVPTLDKRYAADAMARSGLDQCLSNSTATEGPALDSQPTDSRHSVLIVDQSEENREVLQTALKRRGMRTFAAGRATPGLELARRHRPDLIVLDLELEDADRADVCHSFAEQSRANNASLVILGSVRRADDAPAEGEFVAKPYHYGPLVRKIEELLQAASPPPDRNASR